MKRQTGSAITEFVVVSAVLTPLMFGIPMIGSMIDLKQTTVQASRYSAWETTVGTPATTQTLDQRFFSDESAPVSDVAPTGNKLWGPNQEADGTPADVLTGYYEDTAVIVTAGSRMNNIASAYDAGVSADGTHYAPAGSKRAAYRLGEAVDYLGVVSDKTGGDWESMETDGLIRGEASVTIQGNGWLDPITYTQGTVIMNDNWSVEGAVAARNRVRSLVPAGALDNVAKLIGNAGRVPGVREIGVFRDDGGRRVFGYVDVEPLPPSEDLGHRPLKTYEPD